MGQPERRMAQPGPVRRAQWRIVALACNAVLRRPDSSLLGDMFDGAGFVRGIERKGRRMRGASALVVGSGGVGLSIAASLAGADVARLGLSDATPMMAEALGGRLRAHYAKLRVTTGSNEPLSWVCGCGDRI